MATNMRHIFNSASLQTISIFALFSVKTSGLRCGKVFYVGEWGHQSRLPFGGFFFPLCGAIFSEEGLKGENQRGK